MYYTPLWEQSEVLRSHFPPYQSLWHWDHFLSAIHVLFSQKKFELNITTPHLDRKILCIIQPKLTSPEKVLSCLQWSVKCRGLSVLYMIQNYCENVVKWSEVVCTEISPSGNNSGFLVLSLYPKKFRPILRDFDFTSGFPNIKGFKIHFNHFSKLT